MALAVLNGKVAINGHRQHQPCQPLFGHSVFMAQFVSGIQTQARMHARHICQQQDSAPRHVMRAHPPRAGDERDEMQWHSDPCEPAIVAILI